MTATLDFDLETFASERNDEIEANIALIAPAVAAALAGDAVADDLMEIVNALYADLGGARPSAFANDMRPAIDRTEPDGTEAQADRISNWIAVAALGARDYFGAEPGSTKTWITMLDDAVRDLHQRQHGVTVGARDTFDLDGVPTLYPGQPVGPPSHWINCRCVLRVAPAVTLASGTFFSSGNISYVAPNTTGTQFVMVEDEDEIEPDRPRKPITADAPMQWHSIMTVEGSPSGDRRQFAPESLSWRDLPLPLEWQRVTAPEHDGAVIVGRIDGLSRFESQIRSWGVFAHNPEADEVIGLIADQMLRGISPTVDDIELAADIDEEGGSMRTLARGRICSATIVNVPAFAEAYLALGPPPPEWTGDDVGLTASGGHTGAVVVARPSDPQSFAVEGGLAPEELHVTMGYYGDVSQAAEDLRDTLSEFVSRDFKVTAKVSGVARMGNDDPQAVAYLLEAPALALVRQALEQVAVPDMTHPHFTPHMTLGYGIEGPNGEVPDEVELDRLELWWGDERFSVEAGMQFREVSTDERKRLADKGQAMPDGSFPIANVGDLRNAIQAIGRAKDPAKARAHIKKRARALGHPELIPDNWADEGEDFARGPGWVTHPVATRRIHRYWTKGKGAAKIGWGTPHDFYRCRRQLAKYIDAAHLNQVCAQWHHDALGYWPGEHNAGDRESFDTAPCACDTLAVVASAAPSRVAVPHRWFEDPHLAGPTALSIEDGRHLFGHLATFTQCHIGFDGSCIIAPKSRTNYAFFHTGVVETDEGEVPVGVLTMNTGHAPRALDAAATMAHYENTGTIVAAVRAGEDRHGVWISGMVMPMPDEDYVRLRAAAPSGDWRWIGGSLELVGALVVNVPGFPVPRPSLAASGGRINALVAAGIVPPRSPDDVLADRVAARLEQRAQRREVAAHLAAFATADRAERAAALALVDA